MTLKELENAFKELSNIEDEAMQARYDAKELIRETVIKSDVYKTDSERRNAIHTLDKVLMETKSYREFVDKYFDKFREIKELLRLDGLGESFIDAIMESKDAYKKFYST